MKNSYVMSLATILLIVTGLLSIREHVNSTTIALTLLLIVFLVAIRFGSSPALLAAAIASFSLNFFFLKPYHTLVIDDPQNWVAFGIFLLTAFITGTLSTREKRKAEEAERLYGELTRAFEKANEADMIKQSEQMKSALLDAVTHDLRTPLTSMKAAVTTLIADNSKSKQSFPLDSEGRGELLEVMNAEIDRLNRLVEGLIEMAKIEAGAMEPRRSWSNIDEVISIALTRAAGILDGHPVRTLCPKDIPSARIDPKAVAEVLYILIENAVKYSASGTELLIQTSPEGKKAIKLSVEDQGIGIPFECRERVFEKFFRVPSHDSRTQSPGLGMGLAIAQAIVEAHGGKIWIENTSSGKGTRVTFSIPIHEANGLTPGEGR